MTLTPNDSETRLYIDVKLAVAVGQRTEITFGPFSDRSLAEQALVEVMAALGGGDSRLFGGSKCKMRLEADLKGASDA